MLVYTVTNLKTKKVYVGTTASTAEGKWAHLIEAAEQGFDFPLYEEIRQMGKSNFLVEEWADGLTREETQALELEAITTFHGESIKGYKLLPRMPSKRKKARPKSTPEDYPAETESLEDNFDLTPLDGEFSLSENDDSNDAIDDNIDNDEDERVNAENPCIQQTTKTSPIPSPPRPRLN